MDLGIIQNELSQNLIDKAIEIHDRQINILLSKGHKKQEELHKQNGKRKVPEDAPTDCISKRWNKCLYDKDGAINRHYYEIATLTELKNRICSGDVSVEGSKNFKDFEEYLVSHEEWHIAKRTGTKLAVTLDVREYINERIEYLNSRLKWFSKNLDKLDGVTIENSKIHIDRLEKDTPYTDTAGYTDQVFGLSHLLGFKFAPRIRDISALKLYCIEKANDHPKIESILNRRINLRKIEENFDDVLRLAHSIREGKVTASFIMSTLGSYAKQNALATALKEMGKIEKTIFILDYITDESLRRRIQRGLNKGEAMNALARAIFFGKRGEFRERELQDQLQRASALNILINAISIWNTTYLQKAVEHLNQNYTFDESLLKHVAPLGLEHINLLGEYNFDIKNIPKSNQLRPLNINNP